MEKRDWMLPSVHAAALGKQKAPNLRPEPSLICLQCVAILRDDGGLFVTQWMAQALQHFLRTYLPEITRRSVPIT